jgi:hypothetical protein
MYPTNLSQRNYWRLRSGTLGQKAASSRRPGMTACRPKTEIDQIVKFGAELHLDLFRRAAQPLPSASRVKLKTSARGAYFRLTRNEHPKNKEFHKKKIRCPEGTARGLRASSSSIGQTIGQTGSAKLLLTQLMTWPADLNQGRKPDMKWISFGMLAASALAILAFLTSAPMLSSGAYAGAMRGTPMCSDRLCKGINSHRYGRKSDKRPTPH